jgi:starvation-inducible DNA-binding protein
MNFYQLHQLFEEIATKLEECIDLVAERATALGLVAVGTVRNAAQKSRIPEYSLKVSDGKDHLTELAQRLAVYAKSVRTASAQTSDLGDRDTSDIYTEISRTADKYLWYLEAHLQKHCLFEG